MGDVIHTLPAVGSLRAAFPNTKIGWIIEERWAELLCTLPEPRFGARSPRRPLVDRVHAVDTKKWRKSLLSPKTWERFAAAMSELRAPAYQVAVDFQGAIRSALFAKLSGAPTIYGARQPRENVATMWYTQQVIVSGTHVVDQNLSLAAALTGQVNAGKIELPVDELAESQTEKWLHEKSIVKFAILNPGAGWGAKQWPTERYGQVAKVMANRGLKPLINFGPGEEQLAQAVANASSGAAEPVSRSLTKLISLMRRASLFVGGDTGPLHLAAALNVPVVAIFGPTDPARNGPYGARAIVLRSSRSATSHKRRSEPDPGLLEITPEDVTTAATRLLEGHDG
jgi:heptosyltransferase-1